MFSEQYYPYKNVSHRKAQGRILLCRLLPVLTPPPNWKNRSPWWKMKRSSPSVEEKQEIIPEERLSMRQGEAKDVKLYLRRQITKVATG